MLSNPNPTCCRTFSWPQLHLQPYIFNYIASTEEEVEEEEEERVKMASDLLNAQTSLQNYIFNYIGPMSLKCAVELDIPSIVHNHGRSISLSNLTATLNIPIAKVPQLHRLMRLLTHAGFFSTENNNTDNNETMYSLTPLSRILVNGNSVTASFSPFLRMILDPVIMNPFQSMATWFRSDMLTPFEEAHGCTFWEKANLSPEFNNLFNAAMVSDSSFTRDVLVKQCGATLFEGMSSLVDVGGGTGTIARAISDVFPDVKCSVLELAHVVEEAPKDGRVEFIAGDMFDHIPPADVVLLKSILHDWDNEDCVKILRRCKEAIPARVEGGKVIIIDTVMESMNSHPKSMETQLCWDMLMMVVTNSSERREDEWRKIFADAGFSDYKITPALGLRSIMELYP